MFCQLCLEEAILCRYMCIREKETTIIKRRAKSSQSSRGCESPKPSAPVRNVLFVENAFGGILHMVHRILADVVKDNVVAGLE